MNKFKVGDKIVRVACDWSDMPIFSEWVVSSVPNDVEVQVCGIEDACWLSEYFELVSEEINTSQNDSKNISYKSDVLLPKNDEDDFTCCLGKGIESKTYNPLVAQEGGGHYKDKGIQPLEYTMQNNLSFCEGNVVKYISRYKSKNGIEDLAKVIHYALLASYEEYGEKGSTELRNKVLKLLGVSE